MQSELPALTVETTRGGFTGILNISGVLRFEREIRADQGHKRDSSRW